MIIGKKYLMPSKEVINHQSQFNPNMSKASKVKTTSGLQSTKAKLPLARQEVISVVNIVDFLCIYRMITSHIESSIMKVICRVISILFLKRILLSLISLPIQCYKIQLVPMLIEAFSTNLTN